MLQIHYQCENSEQKKLFRFSDSFSGNTPSQKSGSQTIGAPVVLIDVVSSFTRTAVRGGIICKYFYNYHL